MLTAAARRRQPGGAAGEQFAVAVYPFVAGESFSWGQWAHGAPQGRARTRLLGPHTGTADDDKTWKLLSSMIRRYGDE